jgi:FKBP-type peptidyl-prolyl cis-trans isomerase FklB
LFGSLETALTKPVTIDNVRDVFIPLTGEKEKIMNKCMGTMLAIMLLATPAFAEKKVELKTDKDKLSYSVGFNMGASIKQTGIEVDTRIVSKAIQDALSGGKPLMTEQEMRDIIMALQKDMAAKQKEIAAKQQEKMKVAGEKNKKEGEAFLAGNSKKEGVVVLPSGLQYQVLVEGTGKQPKATDTVTVQYRGTSIDGTEFDSSYKRGQPATFALNQVIKGWTEGVQLMKEGGKIKLFVPSELGYGERGAGAQIGPNSTLIFEVELVSVGQAPQGEPQSKATVTGK